MRDKRSKRAKENKHQDFITDESYVTQNIMPDASTDANPVESQQAESRWSNSETEEE